MRVGLLQEQVSQKEGAYFFGQLLLLKDFQAWRRTELDFVNMDEEIPKARLGRIKREVARLYPEIGKQFVERLETDLGESFKYADASIAIYQMFKDGAYGQMTLIQEICLGFLCPDHEFKSKLTQFVYQQLSDVFDFSEEYSRLHQFLRRAAWRAPVALEAASHVNLINTVSSIAQHYGVGLDVIRSDPEADRLLAEHKRGCLRNDHLV
jgi:hypothetical protein